MVGCNLYGLFVYWLGHQFFTLGKRDRYPYGSPMQVKTFICTEGEWQVYVHTGPSQYTEQGAFFTYCYLKNYRGETIRLVSRYAPDEEYASNIHYQMSLLAKSLFGVKYFTLQDQDYQ